MVLQAAVRTSLFFFGGGRNMGQPTCCLMSLSVAVHLQEVGLGIRMS